MKHDQPLITKKEFAELAPKANTARMKNKASETFIMKHL